MPPLGRRGRQVRRVDSEQLGRVSRGSRGVAEALFNQAVVVETIDVERAEPKRTERDGTRLRAPVVLVERPGEHVVALDAWPLRAAAARTVERRAEVAIVVEVELGRLEEVAAAVRCEKPLQLLGLQP